MSSFGWSLVNSQVCLSTRPFVDSTIIFLHISGPHSLRPCWYWRTVWLWQKSANSVHSSASFGIANVCNNGVTNIKLDLNWELSA